MTKNKTYNVALMVFALAAALTLDAYDWSSESYVLLDNSALLDAGQNVTREKYPDADLVLLDCATDVRYEADGTYFQVMDNALKLLTEKGCTNAKVLSSYYNASYSRAKIPLVEIIRPDGTVVPVDLKAFTEETTDTSSMSANIYDQNSKLIKVTVPQLEPGDILHAIYVDETLKPRVPDAYYDHFTFEETSPIIHESLSIDGPAELPLRQIALRNPIGPAPIATTEENNGRVRHIWEFHDIPQAFAEPDMPPLYQCGQHLLLTTFASWKDVSRWYWELSAKHLHADEAIRETALALANQADSFDGKVRAIFDFVSQHIRYMGIIDEDSAPGYEPHDVTRTFNDRAGVCRDKAALLVAMLRAAGMEAFPVLIHTEAKKDAEVAMPYFNHAISAVRHPNGTFMLMDSTAENTRELLPTYLSDKSYLVATPDGEDLRTTPVAPYTDNITTIRSTAVLELDGALTLKSEITFQGIDDTAYRQFLLSSTPDQSRQFFERQLASACPGAKLTSLKIFPADLQDMSEPLRVKFAFETPQTLITDDASEMQGKDALALLKMPRLSSAFGLVQSVFSSATLEKRRFPMQTDYTIGVDESTTILLPDGLVVKSLPDFSTIDTPELLFSREMQSLPGRLIFHNAMACKTVEYSTGQYLALKQAMRQLDADSRKMPIMAFQEEEDDGDAQELAGNSKEDAPDIEYLEDTITIQFEHKHFWTTTQRVKLKVLTYQGSRSYADLSLTYMPLCKSVDVKFARVINGDTVLEPDEKMRHLMDQSSGAAPRYPQNKCLVVNLPGVEIGSIIEYEVVTQSFNRPFASGSISLQDNAPCHLRTVIIDVPEDMNFRPDFLENGWLDIKPQGPRSASKVTSDMQTDRQKGRVTYTWKTTNMPADYREGNQLPSFAYLPTVCFSCGTWKEYGSQLREAIAALGDGGQEVADFVKTIATAENETERLRQIYEWFDQNIRTAGPNFTAMPLSCLTPPEVTLKERYGNSADRAILLAAMLKAAGFKEVGLYLASASYEEEDIQTFKLKYPDASFPNSALVRVVCDKRELWLNDQTRYMHFGTCMFDHGLLFGIDDGRISNMKLPAELADHYQTVYHLKLDDNGTARLSYRNNSFGIAYGMSKQYYAEIQPEERRRAYQKKLARFSQNAKPVTSDIITNFEGYPGTESFIADIKDFAVIDGDYCYLRLPASPENSFTGTKTDERMTPLYWSSHNCEDTTIIVELPPSFQEVAMMPSSKVWKAPGGGGTVQWQCEFHKATQGKPATIEIKSVAMRYPAAIAIEHYQELKESARQMAHPKTTTILLKKTATEGKTTPREPPQ